jgi:hypothetical protein
MSSYLIDKEQYLKAAGVLLACKDHYKTHNDNFIYLTYKEDAEIIKDMLTLYANNFNAVGDQYHDGQEKMKYPELKECDPQKLQSIDLAAVTSGLLQGRNAFCHGTLGKEMIIKTIIDFFGCVRYQTEGDEYEKRMFEILSEYYYQIGCAWSNMSEGRLGEDTWGDIDIKIPNCQCQY